MKKRLKTQIKKKPICDSFVTGMLCKPFGMHSIFYDSYSFFDDQLKFEYMVAGSLIWSKRVAIT